MFTVALPCPGVTLIIISSGLTDFLSISNVSSFGMKISSYTGLLVIFAPVMLCFPGGNMITSIPVPFITSIR